ncbi:hypothetical protein [Parapedobacter koreensis]|uniref:Type IV pilus biogenesis n=1 Tax=Parapedobacter koreensis TaxID=332977 RepID=A0A1H7UFH1_9SPHI|nr:hypothetical protein [Parapedobacter koreensis]SEL95711.1 hypothetical protein SAMN05421740_11540 [Parapedobacter koreensis]
MKRKLTYPLLGLAVLLWGAIFYRVFSGLREDDTTASVAPVMPRKQTADKPVVADSLLLDYRDPFLENTAETFDMEAEDLMMEGEYEYVEEAPYIDWSQVLYLGSINNSASGRTVALVRINGKEYMLKPGDAVDGFTLLTLARNLITVEHQGQVGTITMQDNNGEHNEET